MSLRNPSQNYLPSEFISHEIFPRFPHYQLKPNTKNRLKEVTTEHRASISNVLMSLIKTVKLNQVNAWDYLLTLAPRAAEVRRHPWAFRPRNYKQEELGRAARRAQRGPLITSVEARFRADCKCDLRSLYRTGDHLAFSHMRSQSALNSSKSVGIRVTENAPFYERKHCIDRGQPPEK
jgi:hypothetical protein